MPKKTQATDDSEFQGIVVGVAARGMRNEIRRILEEDFDPLSPPEKWASMQLEINACLYAVRKLVEDYEMADTKTLGQAPEVLD